MTELKGKAAEERMLEDAKRFILASGEFRTVSDLARLLQVDSNKLAQQLNAWKKCGEIFSIPGEMSLATWLGPLRRFVLAHPWDVDVEGVGSAGA